MICLFSFLLSNGLSMACKYGKHFAKWLTCFAFCCQMASKYVAKQCRLGYDLSMIV